MRTTLDLDRGLMDELIKESGCSSKTEAIETAAREYLRVLRMQEMVASFGKVLVDPVYKGMRKKDQQRASRLAKRRSKA